MTSPGRPLLVVEDDVLVASSVSRLLRKATRRPVLVAHDAAGAVQALGDRDDWLGLVLDVTLGRAGEPSGLEVLRFARARFRALPIVVLSGRLEHDVVNEAARMRATYVCKPAGLPELRSFIESVLSTELFPDDRLSLAVQDALLRVNLHATRCADVLRLAVAGRTPAEIRQELSMSLGAYDANVHKLLGCTGEPSLHALVTSIVRTAMGARDPPRGAGGSGA